MLKFNTEKEASEKCGDLEDVEVKITVCGEEYDVLCRPGECLVFRPQDLIKLFPVKGLDKVEVPLEVLHQLASCLEEVSRAKKKPKKRLKLSLFKSEDSIWDGLKDSLWSTLGDSLN